MTEDVFSFRDITDFSSLVVEEKQNFVIEHPFVVKAFYIPLGKSIMREDDFGVILKMLGIEEIFEDLMEELIEDLEYRTLFADLRRLQAERFENGETTWADNVK